MTLHTCGNMIVKCHVIIPLTSAAVPLPATFWTVGRAASVTSKSCNLFFAIVVSPTNCVSTVVTTRSISLVMRLKFFVGSNPCSARKCSWTQINAVSSPGYIKCSRTRRTTRCQPPPSSSLKDAQERCYFVFEPQQQKG